MSDKAKRFELEKGLYAVDTRSGHGDSPSGISGVADRIHKEIEESFNPDAVRRVDVDKMTKMGEEFTAKMKRNSPKGVIEVGVPNVFELILPDGYKIVKEEEGE